MDTQAKGMNSKSRRALRRTDALLHSHPLPEELVTSLFATKDRPLSVKPNTANIQLSLPLNDESFTTVQKRAGISRWLVYESEELKKRSGSGSLRTVEGDAFFNPGPHRGGNE